MSDGNSSAALDAFFADQPPILSVKEVADLLGMREPAVYAWLNRGKIPGYKLGGTSWYVLRDELKASMLTHRNVPSDTTDE